MDKQSINNIPRALFYSEFFIVIQIRWKFWFTVCWWQWYCKTVVLVVSIEFRRHQNEFINIFQSCPTGTRHMIARMIAPVPKAIPLPQCQCSCERFGEIHRCQTTTKHKNTQTVCLFLGIYCAGIHTIRAWTCIGNLCYHDGCRCPGARPSATTIMNQFIVTIVSHRSHHASKLFRYHKPFNH